MAMAQQSMLRAARFEAGFLTLCVIDTLTADNQPAYFTPEELRDDLRAVGVQNANLCLADGLNRMAKTSKGFSLFLRYQAQAERQSRVTKRTHFSRRTGTKYSACRAGHEPGSEPARSTPRNRTPA